MDRNSIIGLLLIGAIMVGYGILNAPTEEEIAAEQRRRDSIAQVETEIEQKAIQEEAQRAQQEISSADQPVAASIGDSSVMATADSAEQQRLNDIYGQFVSATQGETTYTTLENEKIKVVIANKGGRIVSAELKEFHTYDTMPLYLFEEATSKFNMNFFTYNNKSINTDELFFDVEGGDVAVSEGGQEQVAMRLYAGTRDRYLEYVYSLKGGDYMLDMTVNSVGLDQIMARNNDEYHLEWKISAPNQEKSIEAQRNASTVYYKYSDDNPDYLSERSDEKEDLVADVKWVAFKQQYFAAVIIAGEQFDNYNANIETKTDENSMSHVKDMSTNLSIPFEHEANESFAMSFYFGPNRFSILEEYDLQLESLVPLGWGIFGWVNEWVVIPIFNLLDGFNLSYGIIILLMTIIIKMFLFPITYKTYLSSAKMRVLKPEITEISEKHKDDPMKKQQATMALYKKAGVNPLAGCVPMLIQMPILFAMFRFFPASIELRQQSFLWADDLSSYDSVLNLPFEIPFYGSHVSLFTLLMALSMVFYTRMNSSQMSMGGGAAGDMQATQMKIMMYLMPIMMLFFFNSYSSGLSYYYLVANLMSMGQMFAIKTWIIDEDKIHARIQENKKRSGTVKKSKFQQRLEEMAKQRGVQPKR